MYELPPPKEYVDAICVIIATCLESWLAWQPVAWLPRIPLNHPEGKINALTIVKIKQKKREYTENSDFYKK